MIESAWGSGSLIKIVIIAQKPTFAWVPLAPENTRRVVCVSFAGEQAGNRDSWCSSPHWADWQLSKRGVWSQTELG